MKKLLAAVIIALVATVTPVAASKASAENYNIATMADCEAIASWWKDWARPMGAYSRCWREADLPVTETGGLPARGTVGGWASIGYWYGDTNIVVETEYGDVDYAWFVFAHEFGHQWGYRVAEPYGMKPQIAQILGMTEWDEEYWADSFATCLGFAREDISGYGKLPTRDQCWLLDHYGLLPTTSPRGFYPAGRG